MNQITLTGSDWSLSFELAQAERERDQAAAEVAERIAVMAAHRDWMQAEFASEIAALKNAAERLQAANRAKCGGEAQQEGAGGEHWDIPRPQPRRPNRSAERELKALYRTISQRCHPDKTEDVDLHSLFFAAAAALGANDVEAMRSVHAEMIGRGTARRLTPHDARMAKLKAKLREAKEAIDQARQQLEWILCSPDWHSSQQFAEMTEKVGEEAATTMMRAAFLQKLMQIDAQIRAVTQLRPTQWAHGPVTVVFGSGWL